MDYQPATPLGKINGVWIRYITCVGKWSVNGSGIAGITRRAILQDRLRTYEHNEGMDNNIAGDMGEIWTNELRRNQHIKRVEEKNGKHIRKRPKEILPLERVSVISGRLESNAKGVASRMGESMRRNKYLNLCRGLWYIHDDPTPSNTLSQIYIARLELSDRQFLLHRVENARDTTPLAVRHALDTSSYFRQGN